MFPTEGEQVLHLCRCGTCGAASSTGTCRSRRGDVGAQGRGAMSGRRSGQAVAVGESAGLARSASSARTSDSRNRRCPPGVRMDPIHPLDAHLATVLGSTRNISATWCGVSSRSVFSLVTLRTYRRAASSITDMFAHTAPQPSSLKVTSTQRQPPANPSAHLCSSLRRVACRSAIQVAPVGGSNRRRLPAAERAASTSGVGVARRLLIPSVVIVRCRPRNPVTAHPWWASYRAGANAMTTPSFGGGR